MPTSVSIQNLERSITPALCLPRKYTWSLTWKIPCFLLGSYSSRQQISTTTVSTHHFGKGNPLSETSGNEPLSSLSDSCCFNSITMCPNLTVFTKNVTLPPNLNPNPLPHDNTSHTEPSQALYESNPLQNTRTHAMTTRSMNHIHKPKQFHSTTKYFIPHVIKPSCVTQALRIHNGEQPYHMSSRHSCVMVRGI